MSPPSATTTETQVNGNGHSAKQNGSSRPSTAAPLEPGLSEPQAKVQMPKFPGPPKFDDKYEERKYLKGRLAAAFRIFGKYGFDEGVAGHITLRDPVDPTTFWVNPFGVAFSLINVSDLIQVDHKGQIIAGGPVKLLNAAAFMIHSAIHEARPDVMCAAHSHSIYGRSFCALGRTLDIITQDACSFHNVRHPEPLMCPHSGRTAAYCGGLMSDMLSAGPRPLRIVQRHCPRRKRRQRHRSLPWQQKGRTPAESWSPYSRPKYRSCRLLVHVTREMLSCAIARRCGRWG